jgi:hypothetical protein
VHPIHACCIAEQAGGLDTRMDRPVSFITWHIAVAASYQAACSAVAQAATLA